MRNVKAIGSIQKKYAKSPWDKFYEKHTRFSLSNFCVTNFTQLGATKLLQYFAEQLFTMSCPRDLVCSAGDTHTHLIMYKSTTINGCQVGCGETSCQKESPCFPANDSKKL